MSCTGIRIIDDSSLEDNEIFSVVLITADSDVLLHPASANITIVDNDGEMILLLMKFKLYHSKH